MKKLATGLALTAALTTSGCTSIEQGMPRRMATDYSEAICPAIPEALANSEYDEVITRLGSAILACAKEHNGSISDRPRSTTAEVTFDNGDDELRIFAMSNSSSKNDDEFARNVLQVNVTNISKQDKTDHASVEFHKQIGWYYTDAQKFIWTNIQEEPFAAIATAINLRYLDRSADLKVVGCTERMIINSGINIAGRGLSNTDKPLPTVPDQLPKSCNIA